MVKSHGGERCRKRHDTIVSSEVQGDERKRTTDEVSKTIRRCQNWGLSLSQEKSRGSLLTVWMASGIQVA